MESGVPLTRPLVLVNGMPGAGKTTLARALAARAGLALASKDDFKEALWQQAGPASLSESRVLGAEAVSLMWAAISASPGPMLAESFWFAPRDRDFLLADAGAASRTVVLELWCDAGPDQARQRWRTRERHPVHHPQEQDQARWDDWQLRAEPLGVAPVITVDTRSQLADAGLDTLVEQLASAVRKSAPVPGTSPI